MTDVPMPRRRPRLLLGTFWLLAGIAVIFYAFSAEGSAWGLLGGPLLIAYAVYLYRGGRHGVVIW